MKKLLFLCLFFISAKAFAITATFKISPGDVAPMFSVDYVEPGTNTDGTPITNLDHCDMWYSIDGRETDAAQIQASTPAGGQSSSWAGYVAVQDGDVKDVSLWATCTNLNGNTSDKSVVQIIHVDRSNKVPMPPQ